VKTGTAQPGEHHAARCGERIVVRSDGFADALDRTSVVAAPVHTHRPVAGRDEVQRVGAGVRVKLESVFVDEGQDDSSLEVVVVDAVVVAHAPRKEQLRAIRAVARRAHFIEELRR
jgi:hypothetical protein